MTFRLNYHLIAIGLIILSLTLKARAEQEFETIFSFSNRNTKVLSNDNKFTGQYIPSKHSDNDSPQIRNPKRFRVKAKHGLGLRFYRELGSFARVYNLDLPECNESLYVAAALKPEKEQTAVIASCKNPSSKKGFTLSLRAKEWCFEYGDNKKSFVANFKGDEPYNGEEKFVEVFFNRGEVELKVNGRSLGKQKFAGKFIAANRFELVFANYPTICTKANYPFENTVKKDKKEEFFNGILDEFVVASVKPQNLKLGFVKKALPFEVMCEPVDGNEMHFNNVKTFHTFAKYPLPLSFLVRGNGQALENPKINIYLPKSMLLLEAFQSNHRFRDELIKMDVSEIKIKGKKYRKYTPKSFRYKPVSRKLSKLYNNKVISCALGLAPNSAEKQGIIYWNAENDGKAGDLKAVLVKFIEPPKATPQGEFMIMNYYFAGDMNYFSPKLFNGIADLYKLSGIRGKGAAYTYLRRKRQDKILKDKGFTLFDISVWDGPIGIGCGIPFAVNKHGKTIGHYRCPTKWINSKEAPKKYVAYLKTRISPLAEYSIIDYEPWGVCDRFCFCADCIEDLRKRFSIKEKLNAKIILAKYREQWKLRWLEKSAQLIKIASDAIRKAKPGIKVITYTYLFPYNDKKMMSSIFWDVSKDPRRNEKHVDELMFSLYHVNDYKVIENIALAQKTLKKDISVIAALSRTNDNTGSYTPIDDALSPRQLRQKAVLCAAMGIKTFGLWPGTYIDGMYHVELAKACRDIWKHEKFFYNGKRVDKKIKITAANGLKKKQWTYTTWEKDGQILVSMFNFTDKAIELNIQGDDKTVNIKSRGYEFIILKAK